MFNLLIFEFNKFDLNHLNLNANGVQMYNITWTTRMTSSIQTLSSEHKLG